MYVYAVKKVFARREKAMALAWRSSLRTALQASQEWSASAKWM
ncbi:hypothetical protein [Streptomyces sp. MMG1121]|nr:hypothetical protein [Streptomyces sp. MMG1121]